MKIYIVEQNEKLAQSINGCLDVSVINDPIIALNSLSDCCEAIVFISYALLQQETPTFIHGLKRQNQNLDIIVVGYGIRSGEIIDCIMAGAKGYEDAVLFPQFAHKIIKVIEQGEAWLSRRLVAELIDYAADLK